MTTDYKKHYTMINGHKFYLLDDCDALLCKLENIFYDYCMDDNVSYEKVVETEDEIKKLQNAINKNDVEVMQQMLNKYHTLFKRYR